MNDLIKSLEEIKKSVMLGNFDNYSILLDLQAIIDKEKEKEA